MSSIAPDILDRLRTAAGPKGWTSDQQDMAPNLIEDRGLYRGASPLLVKPSTTEQVSAILKLCNETGTKVVPQGGNTSLVGGSVPFLGGDEIILSLSRMNRVRAVDPLNDTMTLEAGVVLANAQAEAEKAGRLFPMRIGSEGSCQIGGNLSTNAGGTAVLRYGNMRDLVLGLEVVLPDGQIWNGLRALRKDNTGYDMKHLFIGGEGTLGVVTAAVLKLFPKPESVEIAIAAVPNLKAAIELLALAKRQSGGQVTAFELLPRIALDFVIRHAPGAIEPMPARYDWQVLIELSSGAAGSGLRETLEAILAEGYEKDLVVDAVLASSTAQGQAFWHLRHAMSETQKPEGGSIKCDISIPVSKMPEFIEQASAEVKKLIPEVRVVAFGHVGDGNVHFNLSQPVGADKKWFLDQWDAVTDIVHGITHKFGGSISAEHGLGRMKVDEITHYKSAVEIEMMRALKRTFDPKNIMNPGKLVKL